MKRRAFIEQVAPHTKHVTNVLKSIVLAQAAHESGNGTSELATEAKALFGIKYDKSLFDGDYYIKDAGEHVDGKDIVVPDTLWRKYPSWEESFKDYNQFFVNGWRKEHYARVLNAKTYKEQAQALQACGYATDPEYSNKIIRIIEEYNLTEYDKSEKEVGKLTFPQPKMVDRRKDALGYPGRGIYPWRSLLDITLLVWHYTATVRSGSGAVIIKDHESYWRGTHKWDIGGYHFYIDRNGVIYWNYDLTMGTYGAGAANPKAIHISLEASSASNYTPAQVKAREELTLWLMSRADLPNLKTMQGHKEVPGNSTTCPGYSVTQLNQFRNNLNVKLKAGAEGSNTSNPQGLVEIAIPKYQAPEIPFKVLEKGREVTLEKDWKWYNVSTNKLMTSKRQEELTGTKDVIAEIKDIDDIGNSRYAYRLEKHNSWILEEFLVEAKEDWKVIEGPNYKKVPDYREPSKPFDAIPIGTTVDIRVETQNWYVPSTKEWVQPTVEIKGATDKIAKVLMIEDGASYSKRAYLLEKFHSWILEQDIVQARLSWGEADKPAEPQKPEDVVLPEPEEGTFYLDGKWYQITQVDK